MAIQVQGFGGVVQEVESTFRSGRITPKPTELLGSFRLASFSGLIAGLAANDPVFSFRWGDATRFALIRFLKIQAAVITGFTAAQEIAFDAILARSFTASDSAGTAITLSGSNQKKRTSLATSLVTDARIAAAVTLTAGTRTLDSQAFLNVVAKTLAAAATVQDASLSSEYDVRVGEMYPIVLAQNEGFIVRNIIALGAAGTIRLSVQVEWDEVSSY